MLEAIARRRCLEAVYNRMNVRLAPHILYTRHDAASLRGEPIIIPPAVASS